MEKYGNYSIEHNLLMKMIIMLIDVWSESVDRENKHGSGSVGEGGSYLSLGPLARLLIFLSLSLSLSLVSDVR